MRTLTVHGVRTYAAIYTMRQREVGRKFIPDIYFPLSSLDLVRVFWPSMRVCNYVCVCAERGEEKMGTFSGGMQKYRHYILFFFSSFLELRRAVSG